MTSNMVTPNRYGRAERDLERRGEISGGVLARSTCRYKEIDRRKCDENRPSALRESFSACALRSMARPQRLRDWPNIGPLIAYRIGSLTAPRPTPVHDSTRTVLSTERRGRKHAEGYARTTLDHLVPVRVVAAPMARMVVRTKFLSLETRASNTVASYLYMHHFARLTVWHDLPCRSQGAWSGGSLRSQPPTR
jgi:hypothetical protein